MSNGEDVSQAEMTEQRDEASAQSEGSMSTMYLATMEAIAAIRPIIQMDGGDIALISLNEDTGVVVVELSGACVGCPASSLTLKAGVERILQDRVPGVTEVRALGIDEPYPEGVVVDAANSGNESRSSSPFGDAVDGEDGEV